jgi:hypothetical protein
MEQKQLTEQIKEEITNPYDGPVTRFVAIYRAMKIARSKEFGCHGDVAEALDDLLDEFTFADNAPYWNTSDD